MHRDVKEDINNHIDILEEDEKNNIEFSRIKNEDEEIQNQNQYKNKEINNFCNNINTDTNNDNEINNINIENSFCHFIENNLKTSLITNSLRNSSNIDININDLHKIFPELDLNIYLNLLKIKEETSKKIADLLVKQNQINLLIKNLLISKSINENNFNSNNKNNILRFIIINTKRHNTENLKIINMLKNEQNYFKEITNLMGNFNNNNNDNGNNFNNLNEQIFLEILMNLNSNISNNYVENLKEYTRCNSNNISNIINISSNIKDWSSNDHSKFNGLSKNNSNDDKFNENK